MESKKKFFKLKVAIFFGYNGLRFHGLQKQSDVLTVEEILEKALYDCELIPSTNFGELHKTGWQRAARTDKGVHAVGNVINCKLNIDKTYLDEIDDISQIPEKADNLKITEENQPNKEIQTNLDKIQFKKKIDFSKLINKINSMLTDIKVFAIKNVCKTFDCKLSANNRLYEYLAPLSLFINPSENIEITSDLELKLIEKLNKWGKRYTGTKNYHNYTKKMKPTDSSAKRYIIEFTAKLIDSNEILGEKIENFPELKANPTKWISFTVKGQSFMYNQIRKMVGCLVQMCHLDLDEQYLENSFLNNVIRIWLAPPNGLFLNRINFDGYNKKKGIIELLSFSEKEEKNMEEFKKTVIYPNIIECEIKNKIFSNWLNLVRSNTVIDSEEELDDKKKFD